MNDINQNEDVNIKDTEYNENMQKTKIIKTIKWIVLIILSPILILGIIRSFDPYNNILGIDMMREAYSDAQTVVLDNTTISPKEIDFPKFTPDFINRAGTETVDGIEYSIYNVNSYFEYKFLGTLTKEDYTIRIGVPHGDSDEFIYEIIDLF